MTIALTLSGADLLNLVLAGEADITFTKLQIGSGANAGSSASALTQPKLTLSIESITEENRFVALTGTYNNNDVTAGFRATEFGVWAKDPDNDSAEILYAYGYTPSAQADYVPANSDRTLETEVRVLVYVGDAEIVTAQIASGVYATRKYVNEAIKKARGYITPEQYGAVGDGVTNDSQALADALAAAGEGGTVMLVPSKIYLVTKTLHMQDGQTLDGNGATLLWRGEPTYDGSGNIISAPRIIMADGDVGEEIPILEKPRSIGGASSSSQGADSAYGYTTIKVGQDPGLAAGDRIILQAARNAMAPESGAYWCGTPTGSASPTHWAEVLTVNGVDQTAAGEWTIQCIGTLTYPYYLPGREAGVDISRKLSEIRTPAGGLAGYAVAPNAELLSREHSTVRKANFLRSVTIRNLRVRAEGVTHSGDTSINGGWKGIGYGNTISFTLCEGAVIEGVTMELTDMGRGFAMTNCLESVYRNSHYEADYRIWGVAETHTYTNAFTFASCWSCTAEGCSTLRAGQSFDTSYAGTVRCPPLWITVRDCIVTESMNSAATNHSGAWAQAFEGCRFINCGRAMAVRSPYTKILHCTFSGTGGRETPAIDPSGEHFNPGRISYAIDFSEPTIWGCVVRDCTFSGSKGIHVGPYVILSFNWLRGNYYDLDDLQWDETSQKFIRPDGVAAANAYAPDRRALGLEITGNLFAGSQCALFVSRAKAWCEDADGQITDYGRMDLGIRFADNTLIDCGANYFPIWLDPYSNGCEILRNRFVRCISGSYYSGGKAKPVRYLIYVAINSVRCKVRDNLAEECGGNLRYLMTNALSVDEGLGTHGNPLMSFGGNRVHGGRIALRETYEDRDITYLTGSGTVLEQLVGADAGGGLPDQTVGHIYDVGENRIDLVTGGMVRASLDPTALWSAYVGAGDSLLRSWCYRYPGRASSARWRVALYDYDMDEETFAAVCAAWDAGEDATGAAVTFSSAVTVAVTYISGYDEDGAPIETVIDVVCPPPINAALDYWHTGNYIGSDPMYSVDRDTGIVTVDVPAASAPDSTSNVLAFEKVPAGYAPARGDIVTVWVQELENHTGSALRINTDYTSHPSFFKNTLIMPYRGETDEPAFTGFRFLYNPIQRLDLGTEEVPWKTLYADDLVVGGEALDTKVFAAFVTETAGGSTAIIDDGADNVPVKSLTAAMDVLQQGSGTPAVTNPRLFTAHAQVTVTVTGGTPTSTRTARTALGQDVYGGSLDVTTGVLTVTHRFVEFDGSEDEAWIVTYTTEGYTPAAYIILAGDGGAVENSGICSVLPSVTGIAGASTTIGMRVYPVNDSRRILCRFAERLDSKAAFMAYLASLAAEGKPMQVVYQLETPEVYQLPPAKVRTFLGANSISASTGNVSVVYRADTGMYIAKTTGG